MENEYKLEDDLPLMESINHFVALSGKEDYKYKFIEILKRIEYEEVVYSEDLTLIEKEFKCPIRDQLVKYSRVYLGCDITKKSELNRFLGPPNKKSKVNKLSFNRLRSAINGLT